MHVSCAAQSNCSHHIVQDDKKRICPKGALDKVLLRLGAAEEFKFVDDRTQLQITRIAEDMLERSIEFGALMASSREANWYEVCAFLQNFVLLCVLLLKMRSGMHFVTLYQPNEQASRWLLVAPGRGQRQTRCSGQ
jgi:hypothetical protein